MKLVCTFCGGDHGGRIDEGVSMRCAEAVFKRLRATVQAEVAQMQEWAERGKSETWLKLSVFKILNRRDLLLKILATVGKEGV